MTISLIAACARNRVIGIKNKLPWNIPEDLKRFKKITTGHPVIMGRKTFESIGRALPERQNIVISRNPGFHAPGASVVTSLESALKICPDTEVFVLGGEEIFRLAIEKADQIYLTVIERDVDGDAFFPEWPKEKFDEIECEHHDDFSFYRYERR